MLFSVVVVVVVCGCAYSMHCVYIFYLHCVYVFYLHFPPLACAHTLDTPTQSHPCPPPQPPTHTYPHSPHHQVLINAGQANAATGAQGYQDCLDSADAVASALGLARDDVLVESTGVIGRRIKVGVIVCVCGGGGWVCMGGG